MSVFRRSVPERKKVIRVEDETEDDALHDGAEAPPLVALHQRGSSVGPRSIDDIPASFRVPKKPPTARSQPILKEDDDGDTDARLR